MRTTLPVAIFAGAFAALPQCLHAQESSGRAWSSAKPIEVVLSNYKFAPREMTLHHGEAYRLHLVNKGSHGHNFSAPAFFAAARIDPADEMAVKNGKVEVAKGETRDIRVIPLTAGAYHVSCTHFLHTALGMKGGITVD